jgi:hypothetical protein
MKETFGTTNAFNTKTPTLAEMLTAVREFREKFPDPPVRVVVMTDEHLRAVKEKIRGVGADPVPVLAFSGIQIESYPTQAECQARAMVLADAEVRCMLVETEEETTPEGD